MTSELITIESLIREHEAIKGHMHSIFNQAQQWETLKWEKESELNPEQLETLNQKGLNARQTMSYLDEGLRYHWEHEERVLPGLIGMPLMEALRIEHDEILKQLKEVNFFLANSSPREFLHNLVYLKTIISNLCDLISEHEIKENTVLQLLKRRFI